MVEQSPSSTGSQPSTIISHTSDVDVGVNKPVDPPSQNGFSASNIATDVINPYSQMDNKERKTTICTCVNELNNLLLSLSVSIYNFHDM